MQHDRGYGVLTDSFCHHPNRFAMLNTPAVDAALLRRYDTVGPRYTSYPTAVQFHEDFTEADYRREAVASNANRQPLSLYLHLPFCARVCYYCACNKIILEILRHVIRRLTAAGYVYIGMDHFAKPDDELARAQQAGTLQRNFQGYSTHADCDLVGLGLSAIGRIGDSYSQNHKTLDAYYSAIDAGRPALWRGVRLNHDDRLRRAVIG